MKAILYLEDGKSFVGESFGSTGEVIGEVVFNTSMTGYQEILTDPSYKYQIVTMTYPMIGNYGVNSEDIESDMVSVSGFVVKEYSKVYSNYRANQSLGAYLKKVNKLGIEGIDTRSLTKHIRDKGAMIGIISTEDFDEKSLMQKIQDSPKMEGMDLVKDVTTLNYYEFKKKTDPVLEGYISSQNQNKTILQGGGKTGQQSPITDHNNYKVVVYDFGVKHNILRKLNDRGCKLTIVPANTSYKEILALKPDGIFLSNGPGDPAAVDYAIENIKGLLEADIPMFGICLGHQLLSLALGAKTYKLKFGHRGGNQPVKNLATDRVEITSQNHGFCVNNKTIKGDYEVTHINLNDDTVEGIKHKKKPFFSVQYHPEASPGPHDSDYLFDEFISLMK